jgi:quercetin dioxygenase-like cupin family protein
LVVGRWPLAEDLLGVFALKALQQPQRDSLVVNYGAMLKYIRWNEVELENLNPLLDRQLIIGQKLMLARVLLKKGAIVPEHSHENEQLTYVEKGALKFWVDGREIVVSSGEVLCIPPHMPHKAEAMEDTVDIDIFYPLRQDWLDKTDAYLRGNPAAPDK